MRLWHAPGEVELGGSPWDIHAKGDTLGSYRALQSAIGSSGSTERRQFGRCHAAIGIHSSYCRKVGNQSAGYAGRGLLTSDLIPIKPPPRIAEQKISENNIVIWTRREMLERLVGVVVNEEVFRRCGDSVIAIEVQLEESHSH